MISEDKVKAMILKSYLDHERSLLMEMSRRHHEIYNDEIKELYGEFYVALDAYDTALRDLLVKSQVVERVISERINKIE